MRTRRTAETIRPVLRPRETRELSRIVIHPLLLLAELEGSQQHDDDEEDPSQRGRVAKLVESEAVSIQVENHRIRVLSRASGGKEVGLSKDLECPNDCHDRAEEDGRGDHRKDNLEEALESVSAVNSRSLKDGRVQPVEASRQNNDVVAQSLPQGHHQKRDHREHRGVEPGDRLDADGAEPRVHNALVG
ncbi:Uncharacterised protein [Chlamydia trachomatis]|nr:Uncharacterised protein [Chlamydia trachomatis]